MTVANILKSKGSKTYTASPESSLHEVARILSTHNIGTVLIMAGPSHLSGIVSERDLVRAFCEYGPDAVNMQARDVMTTNLFTCHPVDTLNEVMATMTENRIRHLPVMVDDKLEGIVSIGDVVKHRITEVEFEAAEMKRYISG